MTLRTRLTLVLGVLVFLPLAAAGMLVAYAVPRATLDRADASLVSARSAVTASLATTCERVGIAAQTLSRDSSFLSPDLAVVGAVQNRLADYAALENPQGEVVARAGALPEGAERTLLGSCSRGEASGAALGETLRINVAGKPQLARAVAVEDVGSNYLDALRRDLGIEADIALVIDGQIVATSQPSDVDLDLAPGFVDQARDDGSIVSSDGVRSAVTRSRDGLPFDVVVAVPEPNSLLLYQTVVLVVFGAVIVSVVFARLLARDLTGPLEEVTRAAEAVAAGDLTRQLPVRSDDEIGRLSTAFNEMTDELQSFVSALESSRDALRGNLERLGEALSATHDLQTLLPVMLETAMSSVGAGAGLVLLGDDEGHLVVKAEHGMRTRQLAVPEGALPGEGFLARVAATGEAARGTIGAAFELTPATGEPQFGEVLAVPLQRAPGVFGVLALFDPSRGGYFTDGDEVALRTLAGQASIAVENVLLHSEAQHASITDPLTGVWNFRYLAMSLNREIERASRFDRPLALLMLDLDRFKLVNDTYGHARGDAVLREFAERVGSEIREVDTLARYGGEEFVLVLPETELEGASILAERVCRVIRDRPFVTPGEEPLTVTVSVGAALYPEHGPTSTELLRAADRALYAAKHAGRDRWSVAEAVLP